MKRLCLLIAAGAAAMSMCAGMVSAQVVGAPRDPLAAVGVKQGQLVQLAIDTTPEQPLRVAVPIGGVLRTLNLAPFSVRAEGFKLYEQNDAGTFEVKPPPINTLRGVIEGEAGAVVAGGVMPDGLYARIILGDGSEWWIEPVGDRADVAAGTHVVYRGEDVLQRGNTCSTDNFAHAVHTPGTGEPPVGNAGATIYIATVAVDTDFEFYNRYGSTGTTSARINLVYNTMNLQYERDVDIRHTVSSITVRTTTADPYNTNTTGDMLVEMRAFWNANNSGNLRDVAHLFTGKSTGGVIGTAYIGVICSSLSNGFGYGVSQTDFNNANLASATDLVAHETGHNWDAQHCTCANPAYTMNPSITSINRFDAANSIPQITAHRNSRGCLSTTGGGNDAPNDDCAEAVTIGEGTIGFNNIGATTDGPAACGLFGDDIWYTYIAPCDGTLTLSTCGSSYDTTLAAYTGSCASLTEVACDDDEPTCTSSTLHSRIQFAVTRNTTYRIRVGGFNGANGSGILTVDQTPCPPPANDDCADAINVTDGAYAFSTIGATTDGWVDDGPGCTAFGYAQTGSDIWFRYVAPCNGTVEFSTCGSGYDTRLAAYASCPNGPFQAISCNDDSCGTRSVLQLVTTAGADYYIRLGGYSGAQGTGTLTVTNLTCPPPANDNCVDAIDVSAGGTFNGTVVNSSNDGTATCGASGSNGDVWYVFTAPSAGTLRATTCGTHDAPGLNLGMDTVLSLHNGCGGAQLACNDDTNTCGTLDTGVLRDSSVTTAMSPGQTVAIRVSKFGTSATGYGPFTLNVSFSPVNDACSDPIVISDGTIPFNNLFATTDGPTACGSMGSDIWYVYQASCDGRVRVDTCGSVYDTVIAVYPAAVGCTPTAADQIACNDDNAICGEPLPRDSFVEFPAQAGQRFRIRVGGFNGARGAGRLTVGCRTACAPCAADYDQSGGVDGDDIGAFFDDWQAGAPCGDVDGSGGVDGDDIPFFFDRWQAGGCN